MKCGRCGNDAAAIQVRVQMGRDERELWLCDSCADRLKIAGGEPSYEASVAELFAPVFERLSRGVEHAGRRMRDEDTCDRCGQSLGAIRYTGVLGCSSCVERFYPIIHGMVRRISRHDRHAGRVPKRLALYRSMLIDSGKLSQRLDEAVAAEHYEEAAQLRDRLTELNASRDDRQSAGGGDG